MNQKTDRAGHRYVASLFLMLLPVLCCGQNNVRNYVDSILKPNRNIANSVTALLVVDENDRVIASWNQNLPLESASTMKLVTTGVALKVLGPDYRFATRLAYTGQIDSRGVLSGDVYIVGGGDPTLGSDRWPTQSADAVFSQWLDALRKEGITKVNGRIVGDARFFDGDRCPDEWSIGDTGYYYGSTPSGLSFAENLVSFEVTPGRRAGDPVGLTPLPPYVPGMTFINDAVTGEKGSGDATTYYATDLAPIGSFGGSIGAGRKPYRLEVSNKFPSLTCAAAFESFLDANGVTCSGCTDDAVCASDGLKYIFTTYSPDLSSIMSMTNHQSNNFFAETIFRTVARALCGEDGYRAAAKAFDRYVTDLVGDSAGYSQYDGSGLSSKNLLSPAFICSFLKVMERDPYFDEYLGSLPVPGQKGTLSGLLSGLPFTLRNTVHAKSGSMGGCKCFTGYVDSRCGRIRFSIMTDHFSCGSATMMALLDGLLAEICIFANESNF